MPSNSTDTLQQTQIKVGDQEEQIVFVQLTLEEKMLETGNFSFIWKNEMGDNYSNDQQQFIQDYIGQPLSIHFNETYIFKGIITQIAFSQNDGLTQDFRVSGTGLGVLLADHIHSTSFYQKDLHHMVDSCFEGIPSNMLSVTNNPKKTDTVFYTVQFAESDFSFLVNLAVRHGEWMYYDGEKIVFGEIVQEPYTLEAGSDILDIVFASSIRPTNLNLVGANYYEAQALTASTSPANGSGLLSSLQDAGQQVYSRTPTKRQYNPNFPTQSSLDEFGNLEIQSRNARLIHITASSRNASIKLGTTLEIKFGNKSEKYIIVQISHFSNGLQDYSNQFLAYPASIEVPHYTNPKWFPKAETQTALVTHNEDADGMDRVKVHFPWQQDNDTSPWIRIQNPYAGQTRGFRFVPEINDEVIIGFENGNVEKPYVIGSFFNGQAQNGSGHENNCIKMIGTAENGKLEFNECEHKVTLTNSNEEAMEGILLNKETHKAYMASRENENNMSMIQMHQGNELIIGIVHGGNTVAQITFDGLEKKLILNSKMDIEITADENIKLNARNISMEAETISLQGSQSVEVSGMEISMSADMNLNLSGGEAKLEGTMSAEVTSVRTSVNSSGVTMIQGGIVQIN